MQLEGSTLGHYRLLHVLGNGGMGEVYLAEDPRVPRYVAIKVLKIDTSLQQDVERDIQLFRHELQAIARLNHRYIVQLFDSGQQMQRRMLLAYMVMPYFEDGTLEQWWRERGTVPRPPHEVSHLVTQAASALQHAHDREIIHRDVKPSNFLIRVQDTEIVGLPDIFLSDFGIARLATMMTTSTQIRGTPPYMAPELLQGHPVYASDQYALAVMAYELLTGRTPFRGGKAQLAYQHTHVTPPLPSTLNPNLPQAADNVLLRALRKEPGERYPDVTDFAWALKSALAHAPDINTIDAIAVQAQRSVKLYHTGEQTVPIYRHQPAGPEENVWQNVEPRSQVSAAFQPVVPRRKRSGSGTLMPLLLGFLIGLSIIGVLGYFLVYNQPSTQSPNVIQANPAATFTTNVKPSLSSSLADNGAAFNWEISKDGPGKCAFQQQAYHVSQSTQSDFTTCTASATNEANFKLQVDMRMLKGNIGGVIFDEQQGEGVCYAFQINLNGSYQLIVYTDNTRAHARVLVNNRSSDIKTGTGASNTLGLYAHNGSFDLYINGVLQTTVQDATYHSGHIGVLADAQDAPVEASFQNLTIWS
ncbi:serine/threonine protein kinase [Ktedonobacter robiniae]|uniref:non-specific serine/threonine protein kinase n=1 Tax=Ktedonobacter robiniae TaxID=2778365 RepID=A0ABQ3V2Z2_9CHLR|nr:serine/threonine-protein kinase [Ktedonobacter robiniae]GHO58855.1 hypothetical protein KSB_73300 [Ktedonobacter robiniae]